MKFNATIKEAEALLHTKYKYYQHEFGRDHIACDEYSIPEELVEHVDMVMPTVHFDVKVPAPGDSAKVKRSFHPGDPSSGFLPKQGKIIATPGGATPEATQPTPFDLSTCNTMITPDCLRALYNFPNGTLAKSSYGIVEYTPQAYLQKDLNLFYTNYARQIPSGTAPTLDSVDGGVVQTTTQSFNDNGESDLDLEYAIALGKRDRSLSIRACSDRFIFGDYLDLVRIYAHVFFVAIQSAYLTCCSPLRLIHT